MFFIMYSEIELHIRIKVRTDCVGSNLMDVLSGKSDVLKTKSSTPLFHTDKSIIVTKQS